MNRLIDSRSNDPGGRIRVVAARIGIAASICDADMPRMMHAAAIRSDFRLYGLDDFQGCFKGQRIFCDFGGVRCVLLVGWPDPATIMVRTELGQQDAFQMPFDPDWKPGPSHLDRTAQGLALREAYTCIARFLPSSHARVELTALAQSEPGPLPSSSIVDLLRDLPSEEGIQRALYEWTLVAF